MSRRLLELLALLASLLVLGGCSSAGDGLNGRPDTSARLLLEGPRPTVVDSGVLLAMELGYDSTEGAQLQVQTPLGTVDSLKALVAGQADAAIVDLHDLAAARDRGADLIAVQAIVATPLAAVLGGPRSLTGVAVHTGRLRSGAMILKAIAPKAVPSRGRTGTAAATGLWPTDGVVLRTSEPDARERRIDRPGGAPPYPELVLAVTRSGLETNGPVIAAMVRTLRRGYQATIQDPASAVSALLGADPGLTRSLATAQLSALSPSLVGPSGRYGELAEAPLQAWARWEQRTGLVRRLPDVAAMFDPKMSRVGEATDPN
jgi:putative hydroxymethylpyrimidine transport system substrate-binding protein